MVMNKTKKKKKVVQNSSADNEVMENDAEDGNYGAFIDQIASLEGSKRFLHSTDDPNDFHYDLADTKVSVDSLINAVKTDQKLRKSVKKSYVKQIEKHKDLKLSAPLPTPQQRQIDRSVTYKRVKSDVAKWDAVVHSRRSATTVTFPLQKPDLKLITNSEYASKFKPKTPLEEEVMTLLNGSKAAKEHEERKRRSLLDGMTLRQAIEKRKELMKYRMLQSYQERKLQRQNKIKSKKYRKIVRKQRQREKIKELELLQTTNPELAAERLEEAERSRILERASLKHRNASKFLQFQAIRAKHNKESQEIVNEQLRKHRELTSKKTETGSESSSSDNEDDNIENHVNTQTLFDQSNKNPWIDGLESAESKRESFREFHDDFKTFWENKNAEQLSAKRKRRESEETKEEEKKKRKTKEEEEEEEEKEVEKEETEMKPIIQEEKKNKKKKKKKKKKEESQSISKVDMERLEMARTIDDLFYEADNIMKQKVERKLKRWKGNKDDEEVDKEEVDEEDNEDEMTQDSLHFKTDSQTEEPKPIKNIDPRNFIQIKNPVKQTDLRTNEEENEGEDDEGVRKVIAEAFADDDVIDKDFKSEKDAVIAANKPKDIDLTLPGWGEWGGTGIKISKRKRKRFTIKAGPIPIRKDANKGHLIFNEDKNDKIRQHQVTSIPFPFTSVADYESSIRTPIGDTFIPRLAFQKMIAPKIKTKIGAIIDPMDSNELVKRGIQIQDSKTED